MSLDERAAAARAACTTRWFGRTRTMADELRELANLPAAQSRTWDFYGEAGPVAELERRTAELLGKQDAAFFPSGIMAQQVALRIWCDLADHRLVAMPDLSHLLVHEEDGPRLLQGLDTVHLTEGSQVAEVAHLAAIDGELAAVLVEVPLRDGGYLVPDWDDLEAFSRACQERGVPLHLDAARIWECQPWFDRPFDQIAGLAQSVYVSFYKGLAGLAGACLAGDAEFVAAARVWRRRMGGTLFTIFPFALAAIRGLDEQLPLMPALHLRAKELAVALREAGMTTFPDEVRSVAFRLLAPGSPEVLRERAVEHMETTGVLVPEWWKAGVDGSAFVEITVTEALLHPTVDEVVAHLRSLVGEEPHPDESASPA